MDNAVKALARALDMPACCFLPGTAAAVARTVVWWPGLAKLEGALSAVTAPMVVEQTRLAAIVASTAQPALPAPDVAKSVAGPKPARTPEEIAAARASVARLVAASGDTEAGKAPGLQVRPSYMPDDRLATGYEAEVRRGGPGAAVAQMRLEALRRRNETAA